MRLIYDYLCPVVYVHTNTGTTPLTHSSRSAGGVQLGQLSLSDAPYRNALVIDDRDRMRTAARLEHLQFARYSDSESGHGLSSMKTFLVLLLTLLHVPLIMMSCPPGRASRLLSVPMSSRHVEFSASLSARTVIKHKARAPGFKIGCA